MLGPESVLGVSRTPAIHLETRPLRVETRTAELLNLRDGQVIQAVAKAQDGSVRLWLKDFSFGIPNGWNVREGDKPFLRVSLTSNGWGLLIHPVAQGAGQPTRLAETAIPSSGAHPNVTELFQGARLSTLLLQPPGFASLMPWLQPGVLEVLARSIGANDWLAQFKAASLMMAKLNPEMLKRAVMSQARSVEHDLAQQRPALDDPKSLLRKLLVSLAQEEGEALVEKVSKSLHRAVDELEAAQLQTVQDMSRGHLALHVVLPFLDADPVELFFHRPSRSNDQDTPALSVDIHSRTRGLGEIWLNTLISGGQQVDLMMWALKPETAQLAQQNASELQFEMDAFDLKLRSFQIFNAPRPGQPEEWTPPARGSVVDARA